MRAAARLASPPSSCSDTPIIIRSLASRRKPPNRSMLRSRALRSWRSNSFPARYKPAGKCATQRRSESDMTAPAKALSELEQVAQRYAIAITPAMEALIEHDTDPIAKQFRPDARELEVAPDEIGDPIGDDAHTPV